MSHPSAIDPKKVGTYPAGVHSGGGYFYDDVLEYRVWKGNKMKAFGTFEEADAYAKKTKGADEPLVLVLQKEHINEPEEGVFEHVKGDRITEWLVEWLVDSKRKRSSIPNFLKEHARKS